MPTDLTDALTAVAGALPGGGEDRPGQQAMAEAVAGAIEAERHLVVQAGTGTGKSLAYLLPAIRSGRRVVVATATKALQDQLATKELPFLAAQLGQRPPFSFAVLKGRSNYLCRQRAAEVMGAPDDGSAPGATDLFTTDPAAGADGDGFGGGDADVVNGSGGRETGAEGPTHELGRLGKQIHDLIAWAETSATGDRAELDFEPHPRAWAAVSVSARECPGAFRCPSGANCFAEWARTRAATADVVVVNTHLYATHVASGGSVLPEHDVLVLDEAHAVEDIMTAGLGIELTAGRLRALSVAARALLAAEDGVAADDVGAVADGLERALRPLAGRRLLAAGAPGSRGTQAADTAELGRVLELARGRVAALTGAVQRQKVEQGAFDQAALPGGDGGGPDTTARRARVLQAAGHLVDDLSALGGPDGDHVSWVETSGAGGRFVTLRRAPIEIGPVLAEALWPNVTAVLTSATVPPLVEERLGLPRATTTRLDVGSPFPYDRCALLYCASRLPDRRHPNAPAALHDELETLICAAGGRTLALFTSWRGMEAAVEALRARLPYPVLAQNDLPKARLLEDFAADESTCLFATMSFWQGVDIPGPTLSLVTIDRLPFPRPDDPLLEARRERAGTGAFRAVDLPRATTLLAQGAGRLIRSSTDTGVVAVFDPRLATAGYRRTMIDALPPMPFTTTRPQAVAFLRAIADAR